MQKNSINAEKFHYCRKIQLIQKNSIMQTNSINAEKCLKIPKMQKMQKNSEKFQIQKKKNSITAEKFN
jgi:ribosomal protein S17